MASLLDHGQAAPRTFPRDPPPPSDMRMPFAAVSGYGRPLTNLLESEIIPQLVATTMRPANADACVAESVARELADGIDFAPLALRVEADALLSHAEDLLARGVSVTTLLVDVIAPAARELGEFWVEDRCDFVDVTMALWRLQEVVHEIIARTPGRPSWRPARRALFSSLPGEQHSFGTVVIDEVFCREGWITDRVTDATVAGLLKRVAEDRFDLIGLTVSCDARVADLPALIVGLRSVSRNPRIQIMLGGRVLIEHPALARSVGADGTAPDARQALSVAKALVNSVAYEGLACD